MAAKAQKRKPNVILLGIDSLRRDHMSCYGYDRLTTPYIDRFAQESTLFEETITIAPPPPWACITRAPARATSR